MISWVSHMKRNFIFVFKIIIIRSLFIIINRREAG